MYVMWSTGNIVADLLINHRPRSILTSPYPRNSPAPLHSSCTYFPIFFFLFFICVFLIIHSFHFPCAFLRQECIKELAKFSIFKDGKRQYLSHYWSDKARFQGGYCESDITIFAWFGQFNLRWQSLKVKTCKLNIIEDNWKGECNMQVGYMYSWVGNIQVYSHRMRLDTTWNINSRKQTV